ncbi:hypothetical protein [Lactococcus petauri]|uniref:hypothetical protein n=2 Tax=Lactococcus petauri TaxID=1940789 RepID=UPI0025508FFD|nr:hypothetical protein [Lactococcus petauri]
MHILKQFLKKNLLTLSIVAIIIGELFIGTISIWQIGLLPLLSLGVIYIILKNKNKPLEKIVSFFILPIFINILLQIVFYFIVRESDTSSILLSLIFIPLSNFFYVGFLVKKHEASLKEIGHMVTTIQSLLFVSTIIGFIVKNPLLFDGILVKTKMESIGFDHSSLSSLSISQMIEALTQTVFLPYLTSTSMIKGWVEYRNFVNEQKGS